jgi:hypothetical protein
MVRKGYTPEQIINKLRELRVCLSIQTLFQVELDSLVFLFLEDYNQVRPHSALGYRPPAPEAILAGVTT